MGADRAPFSRRPARAEIFDIDAALDHETGAIGGRAFLHDPFQNRRLPIGTEDLLKLEKRASLLHRLPPGDFGKELFSEDHFAHANRSPMCSRTTMEASGECNLKSEPHSRFRKSWRGSDVYGAVVGCEGGFFDG